MKTKFFTLALLIVFIFISISSIAQGGFTNKKEATNLYKDSLKDGKWIEYRDSALKPTTKDSAVYYRLAIYTMGKENDTARAYSMQDNKLRIITPYVNGKKEGIAKWYFPSGMLGVITPLHNDSIDGTQRQYYESGKIRWSIAFVNGKKEGVSKKYYETGTLAMEIPYTDGLKNGVEKFYYDNGELQWVCYFINGKKNGVAKTYYETVNDLNHYQAWGIAWETPYTDDVINGTQIQYDIRGQIKNQTEYVKGKKKE
jgi:antitoxin component YwqK of YwqJK toxin-antitoxin module